MKDFKEFTKITDYEGCRLRIMPTAFGRTPIRYTRGPVEVLYADVTVVGDGDGRGLDRPVGTVAIFQKMLISQIKGWWDGRPIAGTLRKRQINDGPLRGDPLVWVLDDVEMGL